MAKTNRRQHGEGSVHKRASDGRWVAVVNLGWRDGKRDRRSFYGATAEEAINARTEFLHDLNDGFERPKGRVETVEEWLWHWLETSKASGRLRGNTAGAYTSIIREHIVRKLGPIRLSDLNEEHVESLYSDMRARGLAESTVRKAHAILKRSLRVAATRRRIKRNPCDNVEPPSTGRAAVTPPDADEIAEILAAVDERRNGARWSTSLAVGIRQGEALGLMWPYVDVDDVDDASIRIDWELVRSKWQHGCEDPHACGARLHRYPCPDDCPKAARRSGRPHKCVTARDEKLCSPKCVDHASTCPERYGGGLILTPPKSAKSRRTIPLPRPVAERLKAHATAQKAERLAAPDWSGYGHDCDRRPRRREVVCPKCCKPVRPDLLAFTQPNGRPVDPRRDWQEWADLLEQLGLDHYRVHDGRHFAGSALLEMGVDSRVVQEILGHADIRVTEGYTHVGSPLARDAASRMGGALWPDSQSDSLERASGDISVHGRMARKRRGL